MDETFRKHAGDWRIDEEKKLKAESQRLDALAGRVDPNYNAFAEYKYDR